MKDKTFSCLKCGGTGTKEDPYKQMTQDIDSEECIWCQGSGQVNHELFNEQFIAFSH
jgi:DnaJ-class molecular chaperone